MWPVGKQWLMVLTISIFSSMKAAGKDACAPGIDYSVCFELLASIYFQISARVANNKGKLTVAR
jgi:hypothetical protein